MKVGIIAEDNSDVDVLKEITSRLLKPSVVGFKHFVGNGCGKLRRKCGSWATNLVTKGCPCIIVAHDLDDNEESSLRLHLVEAIRPAKAKASVVLIPKREIEAWLLYDAKAIASAFRETKAFKPPGNPEDLEDPKRTLGDLVWNKYRKNYLNTVHNAQIAKHANLSLLKKSKSFAPHPPFVAQVKDRLRTRPTRRRA
jgi:hypothetical protein